MQKSVLDKYREIDYNKNIIRNRNIICMKEYHSMAKKLISKSGAAKLREELDFLVTVRRQEMAQKLKEARAQGDLSENAEYDEAKNEQAILETQIAEIQFTLDNSEEVDDEDISLDEVGLGSTVQLKNLQTGKIESFQIVSTNESNFAEGKISDESPIGKGAMKKKVGDTFLIEAPVGELKFEILEIGKIKIRERYDHGKPNPYTCSRTGTGSQSTAPDSSGKADAETGKRKQSVCHNEI